MSALWRLAGAHVRETFGSVASVILLAAAGPRSLVPGRSRVVVGGGIRVIIVNILVCCRIIGVVGLLVKSLTRVWVVVGHSRHCRRIPRQSGEQSWNSSLGSTWTGLSLLGDSLLGDLRTCTWCKVRLLFRRVLELTGISLGAYRRQTQEVLTLYARWRQLRHPQTILFWPGLSLSSRRT